MNCTTEKKFDKSKVCFANLSGICSILQENQRPIIANERNCRKCGFFKTRFQYAKDRLEHLEDEINFADLSPKQAKRLRSILYKEVKANEKK